MYKLLQNEEVYEAVIENGLKKAKHSVWIATANVKNLMMSVSDTRVESSLDYFGKLGERGVQVRLLHSGVPSGPFLIEMKKRRERLARTGMFEMKRCPRVHFKCVLVDSRLIYIGSANFTGAGLGMKGRTRRNFEVGILTDEDNIMDSVAELYNKIWTGGNCAGCGRKKQCIVPLESPF